MLPFSRVLAVAGLLAGLLIAHSAAEVSAADSSSGAIELKDGDRVVLLGGTFIERSQRYGFLEAELTAALPGRNITFRNLGWSGDTVWAESRGIFDPPAAGYQRMIEQIVELKPTVIVFNYGGNEAFAGKAGLADFRKQYEKLLDDLQPTEARFVLVSPLSHLPFSERHPDPRIANKKIDLYRDEIADLAKARELPFVDLTGDLGAKPPLGTPEAPVALLPREMTDTGVHLNAFGYKIVAPVFRALLIGDPAGTSAQLDAGGKVVTAEGIEVADVRRDGDALTFKLQNRRLLPPGEVAPSAVLRIGNLAPGRYSLQEAGETLLTLSDRQWAEGIPLYPLDFEQYEELRRAAVDKNMLYFHRWRPQNITYLYLFRKHEQGQNAAEIPEFDPLIESAEHNIAELRRPRVHELRLVPAK